MHVPNGNIASTLEIVLDCLGLIKHLEPKQGTKSRDDANPVGLGRPEVAHICVLRLYRRILLGELAYTWDDSTTQNTSREIMSLHPSGVPIIYF